MKHILLITCVFFVSVVSAQTDTAKNVFQGDLIDPEQASPQYDLISYLRKNLHYPTEVKQRKIEGRVIVKFVVDENGKIGDAAIIRGIDSECNKEALRLVMHMPAWKPEKQDSKPIKSYVSLPIDFKLNESQLNYIEKAPVPRFDVKKYIGANLHYPTEARKNNIEGKVVVKFAVNERGRVSDAVVIDGIGGGCDEEALKVVKNMPKWQPGEQNGKKVKVYYTLPINFKLK